MAPNLEEPKIPGKEIPSSSSSGIDIDVHVDRSVNVGEEKISDIEQGNLVQPVVETLDWDGPEDPDNPRNWDKVDRVFQVLPPALFSFVVVLSSPIYTTAIRQIQQDFHVGSTASLLPLTLLTLGLALGPLLAAPLSEMFGRLHVYLYTFALFLIFIMASGLAPNFAALCVFRFLAGFVGGPALAVGAGTISDIWQTDKDGGPMAALFIIMPFLGTSLGPVFGGLISHGRTWRWTMWLTLIIGGVMFLWFLPFMKESYKPAILRKRAIKQGRPLPPKMSAAVFRKFLWLNLQRPLHMLCTEPIVFAISLYTAFTFGVNFLFFPAIPWAFGTQYHFDTRESGLVFLANVTGILLGFIAFGILDKRVYQPGHAAATARGEKAPVELRLIGAMIGSFGLPISLFGFAWTCRTSIHWIVPALFIVPFGFGMMIIFLSCVTYLVDTYQYKTAASAIAANGVFRYGLGAVFPLFALQMYEGLGVGLATSLLGIISVVLMAVPFVFYRFGKQFRLRSGYNTLKD